MKTITFVVDDNDGLAIAEALTFAEERDELLAGAKLNDVALEELAGTWLAEICRSWMELMGLTPAVTCIGCGCDVNHACPGGCSWLTVDPETRRGVCSRCAELVESFEADVRVRELRRTVEECCS